MTLSTPLSTRQPSVTSSDFIEQSLENTFMDERNIAVLKRLTNK